MQVAILAGGLGTRLKPYTNFIPKPMMLVDNEPFLLLLLKLLKRNNFTNILMLVGYLSDVIEDYFGDGSKFDMQIKYLVEKEPLGTAGCLRNSADLLEKNFIIMNGDTFIDLDYKLFLKFAKEKNSLITLTAYADIKNSDVNYNMIVTEDGFVTDYSKISVNPKFNAVDAGVYYINKDILGYIDKKNSSLENDVFPQLIRKRKITAYKTKTKFYDIGTIKQLKKFRTRIA